MTDEDRLDELEQQFEEFIEERESYRKKVIKPRLADLEAECDDASRKLAEQQVTIETLTQRVESLQGRLDSLVGLTDEETGGPEKRAVDLRQGLIREARDTGGEDDTAATMHWKEVRNFLAQIGHGEVSKPDCYKAMAWAANEDGSPLPETDAFWQEEGKRRLSGRDVRAICVDTSDLPTSSGISPSRNPTTEKQGQEAPHADD